MKNNQTPITAYMKKSTINPSQPPTSTQQQPFDISDLDATSSIVEANPIMQCTSEQQFKMPFNKPPLVNAINMKSPPIQIQGNGSQLKCYCSAPFETKRGYRKHR